MRREIHGIRCFADDVFFDKDFFRSNASAIRVEKKIGATFFTRKLLKKLKIALTLRHYAFYNSDIDCD